MPRPKGYPKGSKAPWCGITLREISSDTKFSAYFFCDADGNVMTGLPDQQGKQWCKAGKMLDFVDDNFVEGILQGRPVYIHPDDNRELDNGGRCEMLCHVDPTSCRDHLNAHHKKCQPANGR